MSNESVQTSVLPAGKLSGALGVKVISFGDVPAACPVDQLKPVHVVWIDESPSYWMTAPSSVQELGLPTVPLRQSRSNLTWFSVSCVPPLMIPAPRCRLTRMTSSPVSPGGTGCGKFTPETYSN